MSFETRKDLKGYNTKLKSKVTSFLVSYRKKYDAFPISSINKLVKHTNYKALSKLIINDVSIEPELAIRDLQERYKGIKKKLNPSYFNPILRGFNQDAKKTTSKESMRDIYNKYSHQLDAEFKQLDLDLDFCVATLKALNRALSEYNKKNRKPK
jgi:hypothetical protein